MAEDEEFATSLRTAIERSGMSLSEITQRLRSIGHVVSPAALSTWQSGRRQPDPDRSLPILAALEGVLRLPPDALLDLLRSPRPRGRSLRHTEIAAFLPESRPLDRAFAELGFVTDSSFPHERFIHEKLIVDTSRPVQVLTFQIMVRALEEGPCRFPAAQQFAPGEPNIEPDIIALEGCTVGRRLAWPEDRTYATEILVDRYLERGQQAFFSFEIHVHGRYRDTTWVNYAVPRRARDFMVEVEFRGEVLPEHCDRIWNRDGGQEQSSPAHLDTDNRLQAAETDFGPGMLGLRWRWPEDGA